MAIERKLSPTHGAPYRGLRVLDFGQGIASPYCAMLLGVYGADVIKVEPPEGDWSRLLGTTYGNHTTLSAVYNRGKRSLCLDMKSRDGIAIARTLASQSDVLIEGFRPGVVERRVGPSTPLMFTVAGGSGTGDGEAVGEGICAGVCVATGV